MFRLCLAMREQLAKTSLPNLVHGYLDFNRRRLLAKGSRLSFRVCKILNPPQTLKLASLSLA